MAGLNEDQIMYLRDVLGIQGILIPPFVASEQSAESLVESVPEVHHQETVHISSELQEAPSRIQGDLESARLLVLFATSGQTLSLKGDLLELARKMVQAMKLSPDRDVAWAEWCDLENKVCPQAIRSLVEKSQVPVLVFGADTLNSLSGLSVALGEWVDWNGARLMVTHRLEELLAKPALKKPTWLHLQIVMKALT